VRLTIKFDFILEAVPHENFWVGSRTLEMRRADPSPLSLWQEPTNESRWPRS